jgi:hypothetical protein
MVRFTLFGRLPGDFGVSRYPWVQPMVVPIWILIPTCDQWLLRLPIILHHWGLFGSGAAKGDALLRSSSAATFASSTKSKNSSKAPQFCLL